MLSFLAISALGTLIIVPIFAAYIISIWTYAGVYLLVENFTAFGHLTGSIAPAVLSYESFIEWLCFSASTYGTVHIAVRYNYKNIT